jgi:hypothetical protein
VNATSGGSKQKDEAKVSQPDDGTLDAASRQFTKIRFGIVAIVWYGKSAAWVIL